MKNFKNDFKKEIPKNGMTLIEMIFSIGMFSLFMSLFVVLAEFTSNFINKSNSTLQGSEGALIDHQVIQYNFDRLSDFLSQQGMSYNEINQIITNKEKICTYDPSLTWEIPGEKFIIPTGYKICLRSTSLTEPKDQTNSLGQIIHSSTKKLLDGEKPGIYILQALPEEITPSSLPIRRIFCRPKPFC